jgi:hypothetical protein
MGNLPEELGTVATWLESYPNFYVDIDARISELGRQPYTARKARSEPCCQTLSIRSPHRRVYRQHAIMVPVGDQKPVREGF